MLTSFTEIEGKSRADANLILPEINKLSLDVKAGKLTILLVSFGNTIFFQYDAIDIDDQNQS